MVVINVQIEIWKKFRTLIDRLLVGTFSSDAPCRISFRNFSNDMKRRAVSLLLPIFLSVTYSVCEQLTQGCYAVL